PVSTVARPTSSPCLCAAYRLPVPHPPRPTLFPYTTHFRSPARWSRGSGTASSRDTSCERRAGSRCRRPCDAADRGGVAACPRARSEEHTSELQSRENLVCRLLLEKKKKKSRGMGREHRKPA